MQRYEFFERNRTFVRFLSRKDARIKTAEAVRAKKIAEYVGPAASDSPEGWTAPAADETPV